MGTAEQVRLLTEALIADAVKVGAGRIEVRGWRANVPHPGLTSSSGYVRHVIDLRKSLDTLRAQLSENARRSLKKAGQNGVTVRLSGSRRDLETLLRLNLLLRRKHGMLPQPRRFFEAIWRHEIDSGRAMPSSPTSVRTPVAALLCLHQGGITVDKFAVNDESAAKYRGSHALMWRAIELEVERGAQEFDLGSSDASATGLHRWKAQWGGESREATYYFHPRAGGLVPRIRKGNQSCGAIRVLAGHSGPRC